MSDGFMAGLEIPQRNALKKDLMQKKKRGQSSAELGCKAALGVCDGFPFILGDG